MEDEILTPPTPTFFNDWKKQGQAGLPNDYTVKKILNEIFAYKDGKLYWRTKIATKVVVGKEAGNINAAGYRIVGVNKKDYLVHRLIWAMHNGWPDEVIDHINGDTLDNRIENLRAVTQSQNIMNAKMWSHNASGIKGVYWSNSKKCWIASVSANGKNRRVSGLKSKQEGLKVVETLRQELHGEFARHEIA